MGISGCFTHLQFLTRVIFGRRKAFDTVDLDHNLQSIGVHNVAITIHHLGKKYFFCLTIIRYCLINAILLYSQFSNVFDFPEDYGSSLRSFNGSASF